MAAGCQYSSGPVPQSLGNEIGGCTSGACIVQAHVSQSVAAAEIRDQSDHGNLGRVEFAHRGPYCGGVLGFQAHALTAPFVDTFKRSDNFCLLHDFLQQKARSTDCQSYMRQYRLRRGFDFAAEARRGFDHKVKKHTPPACGKLRFLCRQLFDCGGDPLFGLGTDIGAIVQNPVNGCCAKAGLPCNFFDGKAMCH